MKFLVRWTSIVCKCCLVKILDNYVEATFVEIMCFLKSYGNLDF